MPKLQITVSDALYAKVQAMAGRDSPGAPNLSATGVRLLALGVAQEEAVRPLSPAPAEEAPVVEDSEAPEPPPAVEPPAPRPPRGPRVRPPDICPLCDAPSHPAKEPANRGLLVCNRNGSHVFKPGALDVERVPR